jgi:periplasmic divalent cation tolerance protein
MAGEIVVLITTPSEKEAIKIGLSLVKEGLAACVNRIPRVESVFRWQGKICRQREALMVVKTTSKQFEKLSKRVKQLHTYTVPEIIALPIRLGSPQYLKWVREMSK